MATKKISQRKFLKGLNPAPGILSQAPGTLQRSSNLLLTQRGSLITSDGSFTIGTVSNTFRQILSMGVFNNYAAGIYPYYPVLSSNAVNLLQLFIGYPSNPSTVIKYFLPTSSTTHFTVPPLSPALLAPGDPNFATAPVVITNYNPSATSGSVTATNVAPTASTTASTIFSGWISVPTPGGTTVTINISYNASLTQAGGIIGGASGIAFDYSIDGGSTFTSFFAETNVPFVSGIPPSTTQFTIPGLTNLNLLQIRGDATAFRGSTTNATETLNVTNIFAAVSVSSTLSPYGGVASQACLIPQILQFTNTTILILGNGLPPQTVDVTLLTAAVCAPVTNTFTANYPSWQAGVAWIAGNQISVTISGTAYLFTATQGGVSGSSSPTFPATLGATVVDNQVIWRNDGIVSTSPAPRGAAHGIIYAGSLWLANTSPQTTVDQLDGPTVLKMSDTNNPQSWNPLNVAFIGRDDGTQITGLASFTIAEAGIAPTGSLCVFKEFSTFQIFGVFGASDFQITQAQTDLGCVAARSIQFLPGFGIVRLTHLGFAIFDGVRDRLISEEIRPYLFGGTLQQADIIAIDPSYFYFTKGVQSSLPPMYFCCAPLLGQNGAMTRVFCHDLVLKAWMIIDLPWPISSLNSVRVAEGSPVLLAGRSDNGSVERLQEGDTQWDSTTISAADISWSAQLNDVFLEGSSERAFFRSLTIRGQVLDPTLPPLIHVLITLDGQPAIRFPKFIEPQPGSNQFQLDIDILVNAQVAHVSLSGSGKLLIDSIDWDAAPKAGRKVIG